jgi:hypothetical protein
VTEDESRVTFYFDARLPATESYLEPLREMLRQAFAVIGYPALEASEMAGAIESVIARDLPSAHARGEVHLRLTRDAGEFHVDVTAPHLPLTPPPAGLMDRVSVHSDKGGMRHRFTRHLPGR